MKKGSEELREANRKNGRAGAKLSRPGRRMTDAESESREIAQAIGRRLSRELMEEMDDRVQETRALTRLIAAELKKPKPGARRISMLNKARMTNNDVTSFNNSVQDRFGTAKKSHLDLSGKKFAAVQVVFVEEKPQT